MIDVVRILLFPGRQFVHAPPLYPCKCKCCSRRRDSGWLGRLRECSVCVVAYRLEAAACDFILGGHGAYGGDDDPTLIQGISEQYLI